MGKEAVSEISGFVQKVRREFAPQKMLLFGSRAGKEYLKTSDYDLLRKEKKADRDSPARSKRRNRNIKC